MPDENETEHGPAADRSKVSPHHVAYASYTHEFLKQYLAGEKPDTEVAEAPRLAERSGFPAGTTVRRVGSAWAVLRGNVLLGWCVRGDDTWQVCVVAAEAPVVLQPPQARTDLTEALECLAEAITNKVGACRRAGLVGTLLMGILADGRPRTRDQLDDAIAVMVNQALGQMIGDGDVVELQDSCSYVTTDGLQKMTEAFLHGVHHPGEDQEDVWG